MSFMAQAISSTTRHPGPANLSGIWVKVPELSQIAEYEKVLDLWQISGMQKATAKLIEGLEIQHEGNKFHVSAVLCTAVLSCS